MANTFDDDFLDGFADLDDFGDDDLLLLLDDENPFEGSFTESTSGRGRSAKQADAFEDEELELSDEDDWGTPVQQRDTKEGARRGAGRKKGHGGLIALIIILAVLLAAVVAVAVALKSSDGKLSSLVFWNRNSNQTEQTVPTESVEDTLPVETEAAEQTEAVESEEPAETEAEEVTEEPLVVDGVETNEDEAEADTTVIGLLQIWGEDFTPDLVGVTNVGQVVADEENGTLDKTAAENLTEFIAAARAEGYKTISTRTGKYAEAASTATEEQKEHATGLAVDLVDENQQWRESIAEDEEIADEVAWWAEHAYEYGFVLRYPADKETVTKVTWKPYHFVYVGKTIAAEMHENNLCLEEYLEQSE